MRDGHRLGENCDWSLPDARNVCGYQCSLVSWSPLSSAGIVTHMGWNAAEIERFYFTSTNQISFTWLAIPGNYKERIPHFGTQKAICLSRNLQKTGFMKRPDQTSESLFGAKDLEGILKLHVCIKWVRKDFRKIFWCVSLRANKVKWWRCCSYKRNTFGKVAGIRKMETDCHDIGGLINTYSGIS